MRVELVLTVIGAKWRLCRRTGGDLAKGAGGNCAAHDPVGSGGARVPGARLRDSDGRISSAGADLHRFHATMRIVYKRGPKNTWSPKASHKIKCDSEFKLFGADRRTGASYQVTIRRTTSATGLRPRSQRMCGTQSIIALASNSHAAPPFAAQL